MPTYSNKYKHLKTEPSSVFVVEKAQTLGMGRWLAQHTEQLCFYYSSQIIMEEKNGHKGSNRQWCSKPTKRSHCIFMSPDVLLCLSCRKEQVSTTSLPFAGMHRALPTSFWKQNWSEGCGSASSWGTKIATLATREVANYKYLWILGILRSLILRHIHDHPCTVRTNINDLALEPCASWLRE